MNSIATKPVVGSRIRRIRIQMGLSVRELASLAGVSKMSVVSLEQGKNFREATLSKIAGAMGLHVENLLKDEPDGALPYAIHRRIEGKWYDLSDFERGHYDEGELTNAKLASMTEKGCRVPLNILNSRLNLGRIKPTILVVGEMSNARSHQGEEMIYVLAGNAKVMIGTSELLLEEGDSVTFWSAEPHAYGSADPGGKPATILSIRVDG